MPYKKPFAMKPDIKLFKVLNDESKFHIWIDHTIATCHGASLGECTDFSYRPLPIDEESFNAKNKWFYTIYKGLFFI